MPALAAAAVLLGSCASRPALRQAAQDDTCLRVREINAIRPLDDRHAFVRLGASRFYLLTLEPSCRDLERARAIAVEGSVTRVCGDGTALLGFETLSAGRMRCRVEAIERVPDEEAARERIDSGRARE